MSLRTTRGSVAARPWSVLLGDRDVEAHVAWIAIGHPGRAVLEPTVDS
jgi:hypothetical protein